MTNENRPPRPLRIDYPGEITLTSGTQVINAVKCRNISENGVFVETKKNFPVSTPCAIEMRLVGSNPGIVLMMNGHVTRVVEDGVGIGFDELIGETAEHLKKLIMYNAKFGK